VQNVVFQNCLDKKFIAKNIILLQKIISEFVVQVSLSDIELFRLAVRKNGWFV